jgi:hypothetical protein
MLVGEPVVRPQELGEAAFHGQSIQIRVTRGAGL